MVLRTATGVLRRLAVDRDPGVVPKHLEATLAIEDSARTGDRMVRKVFAFRPQT